MNKQKMPKELKDYLSNYVEEYFHDTFDAIIGLGWGALGLSPRKGAVLEGAYIETEDGNEFLMEAEKKKANTGDLIKDMAKSFGTSDDDKGKTLNLFKGLIFSDDKKAKEFLKKLDKATSEIAKEMKESVEKEPSESKVTIKEDRKIGNGLW